MINIFKSYFVFFLLLLGTINVHAQVTNADIKAAYTYRLTEHIEWQNLNPDSKFTIGVFSDDEIMLNKFEYLAKNRKIKNKEIQIIPIKDIKQLKQENLNILFINNKRNTNIESIFGATKDKNTLLISDKCTVSEAVMINFLPSEKDELIHFEINKKNTTEQKLIINQDILLLGGSYIDVRELFYEKEQELVLEKEKLEKSTQEINKQREFISQQDKIIEVKENQIQSKELIIAEKEATINEKEQNIKFQNEKILIQENKLIFQKASLSKLSKEIVQKQKALNDRLSILEKQEKQIAIHKTHIENTKATLQEQEYEISKQVNLIQKQEGVLAKQYSELKQQRAISIISFGIIILALVLGYTIFKSYKIKKRANIKLKEYNDEILAQNEEILAQREELVSARDSLEATNQTLEKLSIVAKHTSNAVLIIDNNDNIEWVNEGFARTLGYELKDLKNKFGHNLRTTNHIDFNKKLEECKNTKKTVEYIIQSKTKWGEVLWMHASLTPILDENGNIKKLVAIETNVTDLKKAEEDITLQKNEIEDHRDEIKAQRDKVEEQRAELEKHHSKLEKLVDQRTKQLITAKEKAEESDKMKSSFIANMSHEIRTPMNAVVGFSDLISDPGRSNEEQLQFSNIIKTNADSLIRLIDDIIDISSIEAGKLAINKADCEIHRLLEELHLSFKRKIKSENRTINLELFTPQDTNKLTINTDKTRLTQVFTNLLDNALKFTEEGNIEFGYKQIENSLLYFWVKDSGIGIDKQQQDIIFERFHKIEDDAAKLYRGTGLGLAICKAIVTDLGGKIELKSKLGHGSSFSFTIPI